MIQYDRLWDTMADRGMTQYKLIKFHGFSAGQIGRLKKNMHVSTHTLETLCRLLDCRIEDIVEYVADESAADQTDAGITAEQTVSQTEPLPQPPSPIKASSKAEKTKKGSKAKKASKKSPKNAKKSRKK